MQDTKPQETKPQDIKVPLDSIIKEFELEMYYSPRPPSEILVENNDINRPGLQFAGYYEYYDNTRIQIVGKAEFSYLNRCSVSEKTAVFEKLLSTKPPAIIFARGIEPEPEILEIAKKCGVATFGTFESTSVLISKIIAFLNLKLAPHITRHGVLIEIYGEGMFILGDSGVGKSETAIELVKRGHRLIADDAVEIRKTSNITLVGSPPDNIKHFLEIRGIGIINVMHLFGIGAVKPSEKINMVVELEFWDSEKEYDRIGVDNKYISILGVKIPHMVVPVKPGRNLAVILEIAAMNNRQRRMGYNAAQDLLKRLGLDMEATETITEMEMIDGQMT